MKLNILTLHNRYLYRGGEDESVDSQVNLLRAKGHFVELYEDSNERIEKLGKIRTGLKTIWSIEAYRNLKEKLVFNKYHVMDCQNLFPLFSPSVYYAAKELDIPVIQTLRNYRLLCSNALFYRDGKVCEDCLGKKVPTNGVRNKCYRDSYLGTMAVASMVGIHHLLRTWDTKVDLYLTLTQFARKKFIEAGFPANKILVKPNFVYPDPGAGTGSGDYFIYVGRLTHEKGVLTLVNAWTENSIPCYLKIIGDGPLSKKIEDISYKSTNIQYLGKKGLKEIYDLIGEAKALIFPSEWYETFGRVAIEAFAKGTPVIASNIGAISEIVEDERTGFLFKPGDISDLTDKIYKLLSLDYKKTIDMRRAARNEYEKKYTADINYKLIMNIYQMVMDKKK